MYSSQDFVNNEAASVVQEIYRKAKDAGKKPSFGKILGNVCYESGANPVEVGKIISARTKSSQLNKQRKAGQTFIDFEEV